MKFKTGDPLPDNTHISLERTMCFGACPIYRVDIEQDGTVTFTGKRFVRHQGIAQSKISIAELEQLIEAFQKARYLSLRDFYDYDGEGKPGCQVMATDQPSAISSLRFGDTFKEIRHYGGCIPFKKDQKDLETLRRLEDLIDQVAKTESWIH